MKTYDNFGRLIGEINVVVIPTQGVITTNTTYDGDRVLSQTITRREFGGTVRTFEVLFGGKLLP
jgi:hypothetical protein